jgi:hypothetical protein
VTQTTHDEDVRAMPDDENGGQDDERIGLGPRRPDSTDRSVAPKIERQNVAAPTRRARDPDLVDLMSMHSFPASDPPSVW